MSNHALDPHGPFIMILFMVAVFIAAIVIVA